MGYMCKTGKIYNNHNDVVYEGDFLNNLAHGQGKYYRNNRLIYVGNSFMGNYYGLGCIKNVDNEWKYGNFVDSVLISEIKCVPKHIKKIIDDKHIVINKNKLNPLMNTKTINTSQLKFVNNYM